MFSKLNNSQSITLVFVISLVLTLIGSWSYPIYILDEAKNAEAAREMLINFDFIVPTFNAILRTDKPPLHYYFMMLGYKFFGINALGARFFSGVFGALTIAITFYFTNKFSNRKTAWITTIVLLSSVFFIQEFHLSVPDPYLIFFISSGLWCFFDFYISSNKKMLWLMYICFGLGTLAKGPISIALPGLICILFLIFHKDLTIKKILEYKPFFGLILLLAVVLPWYIMIHQQTNGAWTKGFFLDHNLSRFGNKMEGHGGVFLITWAFVLLGLMPFSFFIPFALKKAYQFRRQDKLWLFGSIVSLVFIVFFSISGTKLPNYTMPCYPFLALVISKGLEHLGANKKRSPHASIVLVIITLVSIALPISGKIALSQEKELVEIQHIAYWLFPTTVLTTTGAVLFFKHKFKAAFLSIASGWILLAPLLFLLIYPRLTQQSPTAKANQLLKNQEYIVAYKRFDAAFPFNYHRTFEVISEEKEIQNFFETYPKGYLITNERNIEPLENIEGLTQIFECKALFENHITRIFEFRAY